MNDKEKFLAEQLGECVPEWKCNPKWNGIERESVYKCLKCGNNEYRHNQINPFNLADQANKFFILWNWAKKQEWWDDFVYNRLPVDHSFVSYEKFSTSLYNFLKEQNETA